MNSEEILVKPVFLNNYAYLETKITDDLYEKLLKECLNCKKNNKNFVSGLTSVGVPSHHLLEKNKEELIKYLRQLILAYEKIHGSLKDDITIKNNEKNYIFQNIWINLQKKNEFFPNHQHDGTYSFVIFIKLPKQKNNKINLNNNYMGSFEFTYNNVLGSLKNHLIKLDKNDEQKILFFPAKLQHCVYPFFNDNEVRITISGNIS